MKRSTGRLHSSLGRGTRPRTGRGVKGRKTLSQHHPSPCFAPRYSVSCREGLTDRIGRVRIIRQVVRTVAVFTQEEKSLEALLSTISRIVAEPEGLWQTARCHPRLPPPVEALREAEIVLVERDKHALAAVSAMVQGAALHCLGRLASAAYPGGRPFSRDVVLAEGVG